MDRAQRGLLERRLHHKRLYKNARGKTPPWKDVYRERCKERLRSSRSQLVDRFRAAGDTINHNNNSLQTAMRVQDVMEVEWVAMSPDSGFPLASEDDPQEDEQTLLELMEEIQQELMSEEEQTMMDVLKFDTAALASQVALQAEEVICPICQETVNKSAPPASVSGDGPTSNLLVCGCGLALQGANLTLNTVKSSLENTLSHHGQACIGRMSFTSTTDTQGANVLITCSLCDWMSFLL
ncbi:RPA-interacting protein B-like isoform X2 [Eriocheir sinensis]|uniref:RPA-interacting protein B-like isoform X2 n=1 Tax=Eriocheir sinensis TaxID=95602 RepID=UPI0021C7A9E9|nr:RPA-interacting protein B-like isoform X2 [Eriocheir sinensis]